MAKRYIKNSEGIVSAVTTENLQLEKPLINENYDIEVHNRNMDKLDKSIHEALAKANEAFQNGVNVKSNIVEVINSKVTVNDISTNDNWETIINTVNNIKEGRGNAVAGNVLSGKTFTNDSGQMLTGTMANRGGTQTITPSTSNKTLNSGYYSGNITVKGDANLIASNILSGKSIFGVAGSVIAGKRWATGTATPSTNYVNAYYSSSNYNKVYKFSVSNLAFKPSIVVFHQDGQYSSGGTLYNNDLYAYNGSDILHLGANSYHRSYTPGLFGITNNGFNLIAINNAKEVLWIAFE